MFPRPTVNCYSKVLCRYVPYSQLLLEKCYPVWSLRISDCCSHVWAAEYLYPGGGGGNCLLSFAHTHRESCDVNFPLGLNGRQLKKFPWTPAKLFALFFSHLLHTLNGSIVEKCAERIRGKGTWTLLTNWQNKQTVKPLSSRWKLISTNN